MSLTRTSSYIVHLSLTGLPNYYLKEMLSAIFFSSFTSQPFVVIFFICLICVMHLRFTRSLILRMSFFRPCHKELFPSRFIQMFLQKGLLERKSLAALQGSRRLMEQVMKYLLMKNYCEINLNCCSSLEWTCFLF